MALIIDIYDVQDCLTSGAKRFLLDFIISIAAPMMLTNIQCIL